MQNGLLFGLPIVLDTDREDVVPGDRVLLTYQGQQLAAVEIDSKWMPNKPLECLKAYGTSSLEHPAVQMVAMERGRYYLGARSHCGFPQLPSGWPSSCAAKKLKGWDARIITWVRNHATAYAKLILRIQVLGAVAKCALKYGVLCRHKRRCFCVAQDAQWYHTCGADA